MKYRSVLIYCIVIINIFSTVSCTTSPKNKDIDQLRNELPQIELPISFNSSIKAKYKTVEIKDNSIIQDLTEKRLFSLFGKLFETESNITILGWLPTREGTPAVITIDNTGEVLHVHELYENVKDSANIRTVNYATVFRDKKIVFTDSTFFQSKVNETSKVDSVVVATRTYAILTNGMLDLKNF